MLAALLKRTPNAPVPQTPPGQDNKAPPNLDKPQARIPGPDEAAKAPSIRNVAPQVGGEGGGEAAPALDHRDAQVILPAAGNAAGDGKAVGGAGAGGGAKAKSFAELRIAEAGNINTPHAEGGRPLSSSDRLAKAMALGRKIGKPAGVTAGPSLGPMRRGDAPRTPRLAAADLATCNTIARSCEAKIRENAASPKEAKAQCAALREGIKEGIKEGREQARVERMASEGWKRAEERGLAEATHIRDWHDEHGLAIASSHKREKSSDFKMNWGFIKHSTFWGAGNFESKVGVVLKHLHERGDATEHESGSKDMRPFMQAGIELALRNGSQHISTGQAIKLVETLCSQAGDPSNKHCLAPDQVRMVVAGMVAVWDPQVSAEVALHLLKTPGGEAPPSSAEGSPGPSSSAILAQMKLVGAQKQKEAVVEGLGIGMAWKGMALIDQYASNVPPEKRPAGFDDLLGRMRHGQGVGKSWLIRMEMALPALQGAGGELAQMRAVILMRRFFVPHDMDSPEAIAKASPRPQDTADDDGLDETDTAEGVPIAARAKGRNRDAERVDGADMDLATDLAAGIAADTSATDDPDGLMGELDEEALSLLETAQAWQDQIEGQPS